MYNEKIPVTVWLTPQEIGLMDREIERAGSPDLNPRSELLLLALRYCLLQLVETGYLKLTSDDEVGFIGWYRDLERRVEQGEYVFSET